MIKIMNGKELKEKDRLALLEESIETRFINLQASNAYYRKKLIFSKALITLVIIINLLLLGIIFTQ